jgi:hypothetical protein
MDRVERATWVCYVMAGTAAVAKAATLKWPKTAIPLGIAAALAAIVGSCEGLATYPGWRTFRDAEFRIPSQGPPSENEKMSPLNTANKPNSVSYPLQRNFVA